MNKQEINITINEMLLTATLDLDKYYIREDYFGLYSDIVSELASKASGKERLIYDYANLMEREQKIYSPFNAYKAGVFMGYNNAIDPESQSKAFLNYIGMLHSNEKNACLLNQRDMLFIELCDYLDDTRGLMSDFNDLFRKCHCVISSNLSIFFDMGYNSTCRKNSVAV